MAVRKERKHPARVKPHHRKFYACFNVLSAAMTIEGRFVDARRASAPRKHNQISGRDLVTRTGAEEVYETG